MNAAMFEETTAASVNLSSETQDLARLISQFKFAGAEQAMLLQTVGDSPAVEDSADPREEPRSAAG